MTLTGRHCIPVTADGFRRSRVRYGDAGEDPRQHTISWNGSSGTAAMACADDPILRLDAKTINGNAPTEVSAVGIA